MKPYPEAYSLPRPKPQFWMVAGFKMTNAEIRKMLGDPHYTETDGTRTHGGNEDHWAFTLASGQHVGIESRIPYGTVILYSDKPDLKEILCAIELPPDLVSDSSRFEIYNPPFKA
jgi:hypothetical protein